MFLTWKLWAAIRAVNQRNPIIHLVQTEQAKQKPFVLIGRVLQIICLSLYTVYLVLFPIPAIVTLFGILLAMPSFVLIFNSSLLGTYWIGEIAENIARYHRQGRFDLMSLTPEGAVGTAWFLAMGIVHRQEWLEPIYRILKTLIRIILVLLSIVSFFLILGSISAEISPDRQSQLRILNEILMIALFLLAFWLDHIQSIVLAVIMGLLLPEIHRDEGILRITAMALYLLLQIAVYLLIFVIHQTLSTYMNENILQNLAIGFLVLFCFYALRESLIQVLWRGWLHLYSAKKTDTANIFA